MFATKHSMYLLVAALFVACGTPTPPNAVDSSMTQDSLIEIDASGDATWTQIYARFRTDCAGGTCHSDGARQPNFAHSNRMLAYNAAFANVNGTNPEQSLLYFVTTASTGTLMPDGRPRNVPWAGARQLLRWIEAGAPNN